MQRKIHLVPVIMMLGVTQGCSFSTSSDSSSGSSGSFSDSSGSSMSSPSSSEGENSYEVQIMNYTHAYLTAEEFDREEFSQGISEIAQDNGVTSWEDDKETLIGIGRALKKSNLTGVVFETYKKSLANSKTNRMQFIEQGYQQ